MPVPSRICVVFDTYCGPATFFVDELGAIIPEENDGYCRVVVQGREVRLHHSPDYVLMMVQRALQRHSSTALAVFQAEPGDTDGNEIPTWETKWD